MIFKFEKLSVWKRAVDLSVDLIKLANSFPKKYQFSLGGQLRRASLSIPTNIAEGAGRGLVKDQANFYRIAKGSVYEVVSILAVAQKLGLISNRQFQSFYDETNQIAAMLTGLMKPKNRS